MKKAIFSFSIEVYGIYHNYCDGNVRLKQLRDVFTNASTGNCLDIFFLEPLAREFLFSILILLCLL